MRERTRRRGKTPSRTESNLKANANSESKHRHRLGLRGNFEEKPERLKVMRGTSSSDLSIPGPSRRLNGSRLWAGDSMAAGLRGGFGLEGQKGQANYLGIEAWKEKKWLRL